MNRVRPSRLILCLAVFLIALFGITTGRSLAAPSAMSMPQNMPQGQCQASCDSQRTQSSPSNVAVRPTNVDIDEQSIDPQPTEPYYLAFIGVGWITIITIAAAYLLKYLRWRPPDFIKLYAVYRF
jgi:hypothetical protein